MKPIKIIAFDLMEVILNRKEPDEPVYADFNSHFGLDDRSFYPWVAEKYHLNRQQAEKRVVGYMEKYYHLTDSSVFELSKKYPFALVSNQLSAVNILLAKMGIDKYFSWTVNSSVAGVRKPDPSFFQILLDKTKAKPREILYVDDCDKYIQAAKEMGFNVLNFNADHKQTNLKESVELWLDKNNSVS